jgi:hypothetical protein
MDQKGHATSHNAMCGTDFLRKHRSKFNTLTVGYRVNAKRPWTPPICCVEAEIGFVAFFGPLLCIPWLNEDHAHATF